MLDMIFYCIQPIHISEKLYQKLLLVNMDKEKLEKLSGDTYAQPKWKENLDNYYTCFHEIVTIKDISKSARKLKLEIVEQDINLEYLAKEISFLESVVIFDNITKTFFLLLTLQMKTENKELINNPNLYKDIRKILVTGEDFFYTETLASIQKEGLEVVVNTIEKMFPLQDDKFKMKYIENTGNITVVVLTNGYTGDKEKIIKKFIDLNVSSERVSYYNNKIIELEREGLTDYYYFGGRFHTIIINKEKDFYRYLPIQYHMQNMWFFISKQFNHIIENNEDIQDLILDKNFQKNTKKIQGYSARLRMSMESDSHIYDMVEKKWNIEKTLKDFWAHTEDEKQKSIEKKLVSISEEVFTDSLTQTYTRKWLKENIVNDGNFIQDGVLGICDLDDFKTINDTYGHVSGDEVLKYIAHQLKRVSEDVVRFGGDEFIVFSDSKTMGEFFKSLKMVQQKVHEKDFVVQGDTKIKISFSFGVDFFTAGDNLDQVLNSADKKLYQNKKNKQDEPISIVQVKSDTIDNMKDVALLLREGGVIAVASKDFKRGDKISGELDGQKINVDFLSRERKIHRLTIQEYNFTEDVSTVLVRPLRTKFFYLSKKIPSNCSVKKIDGKYYVVAIEDISVGDELHLKN